MCSRARASPKRGSRLCLVRGELVAEPRGDKASTYRAASSPLLDLRVVACHSTDTPSVSHEKPVESVLTGVSVLQRAVSITTATTDGYIVHLAQSHH